MQAIMKTINYIDNCFCSTRTERSGWTELDLLMNLDESFKSFIDDKPLLDEPCGLTTKQARPLLTPQHRPRPDDPSPRTLWPLHPDLSALNS